MYRSSSYIFKEQGASESFQNDQGVKQGNLKSAWNYSEPSEFRVDLFQSSPVSQNNNLVTGRKLLFGSTVHSTTGSSSIGPTLKLFNWLVINVYELLFLFNPKPNIN